MGLITISRCLEGSPYFYNVKNDHLGTRSLLLTRVYSACKRASGFRNAKIQNSVHGMNGPAMYRVIKIASLLLSRVCPTRV